MKDCSPEDVTRTLPEDLVVLQRRGELSEPQRRRLELALGASDSLRQLQAVGRAFDEVPKTVQGDGAILSRIAERARERGVTAPTAQRRPRPNRILVMATLAAVALGSLSAAAMVYRGTWQRLMGSSRETVASTDVASSRPAATSTRVRVPKPLAPAPLSEVKTQPPKPKRGVASTDGPPDSAPMSEPVPLGASELFSKANAARRQGDVALAMHLYQRLEREHATSAEASLSHVVRGRIHLNGGDASQALGQFNRYLVQVPDGPLAQEALDGKARALSRLGRTAEERSVWLLLLQRYPKSIYADHARARVAQLD